MANPPRGATPMKFRLLASRAQPLQDAQACVQQLLHFTTQLASGLAVDSPQAMAKTMEQYCKFLVELDRKADSMRSIRVPVDAIRHLDTSSLGLEAWRQDLVKRLQRLHQDSLQKSTPLDAASHCLQQAGWEAGPGGLPTTSQPPPAEPPSTQPPPAEPPSTQPPPAEPPSMQPPPAEPHSTLPPPAEPPSPQPLPAEPAFPQPPHAEPPSLQPPPAEPPATQPPPAGAPSTEPDPAEPPLRRPPPAELPSMQRDTLAQGTVASPLPTAVSSLAGPNAPQRTVRRVRSLQIKMSSTSKAEAAADPRQGTAAFAAEQLPTAPQTQPNSGTAVSYPLQQPRPEEQLPSVEMPQTQPTPTGSATSGTEQQIRQNEQLDKQQPAVPQTQSIPRGAATSGHVQQPLPGEYPPTVPPTQLTLTGPAACDPAQQDRPGEQLCAVPQTQATPTGEEPSAMELVPDSWTTAWAAVASEPVSMTSTAPVAEPLIAPAAEPLAVSATEQTLQTPDTAGAAVATAAALASPAGNQGREGTTFEGAAQQVQPSSRHPQQHDTSLGTLTPRGKGGRGRRGAARIQAGSQDQQKRTESSPPLTRTRSGNVPRVVVPPPPPLGHTRTLRSHTRAQAAAAAGTGAPSPAPPPVLQVPPSRSRGRGRGRGRLEQTPQPAAIARPAAEEATEQQPRHPPPASVPEVEEGARKRLRVKL